MRYVVIAYDQRRRPQKGHFMVKITQDGFFQPVGEVVIVTSQQLFYRDETPAHRVVEHTGPYSGYGYISVASYDDYADEDEDDS